MNENERKRFKENLKELRMEHGLSQTDLARKLHISRYILSDYERGKHLPTLPIVIPMAKLFGVSVDYMLGLSDVRDISHKTKPRLTVNDLCDGFSMHCDTRIKARKYLKFLDAVGLKWATRSVLTYDDFWYIYEEKTCYTVKLKWSRTHGVVHADTSVVYADTSYLIEEGYTIHEFDDYDWNFNIEEVKA